MNLYINIYNFIPNKKRTGEIINQIRKDKRNRRCAHLGKEPIFQGVLKPNHRQGIRLVKNHIPRVAEVA